MRLVRTFTLLTVIVIAFASANAQPPGGGGPPGGDRGGRSRGGFGGNPDEMFDRLAKGKPTIDVNAPENSFMKRMMEKGGQPIPPNGQVTREMFKANMEKMAASRGQRGDRGGPPGGFGGPPGAVPGGPGAGPGADWIDSRFRDSDKNKDGYITLDEASERLKPMFAQYDTNRDGKLDAAEYKTGVSVMMGGASMGGGSSSTPGSPGGPPQWGAPPQPSYSSRDRKQDEDDEERVRVSVSRYGKLPKEAPGYFTECDDDRDGMVGLYEWRRHEKKTAEFVEMDLNKDGYLTADEWMRYNRIAIEKRERESEADDGTIPRSPSSSRSASTSDSGGDRKSSERGKGPPGSDKAGRGKGSRGGDNPWIVKKK